MTDNNGKNGTATINGTPVSAPAGAVAYAYADALDDARWIYDEVEATDVERIDASLIEWVC